jgi:hypothetical protein
MSLKIFCRAGTIGLAAYNTSALDQEWRADSRCLMTAAPSTGKGSAQASSCLRHKLHLAGAHTLRCAADAELDDPLLLYDPGIFIISGATHRVGGIAV